MSLVWFVLVDSATGKQCKGTNADAVTLPPSSVLVHFRDAVKAKCFNRLSMVDSAELVVFKNKHAFDNKEEKLTSSLLLHELGETEEDALIVVVPTQTFGKDFEEKKNLFEGTDQQLRECFRILEENNFLRENFKAIDEKKFFKLHPFLHAHRLGQDLPSRAAVEMKTSQKTVLIGVSGCGKTHAIYLNAINSVCVYLTPNSWILKSFVKDCRIFRVSYDCLHEDEFREKIQDVFLIYIAARYIVLLYLKQALSLTNEYLFFLQSVNDLDSSDFLIHKWISKYFANINIDLSSCFLAVDEAQKYFTTEYELLYRTGVKKEQRISFARFFTWAAPVLGAGVVISGTALRLRDMDHLGSGNRPLAEYGIKIVHEFDYFDTETVKDIAMSFVKPNFVEEDVLERMCFLLQGRPRILMNFLSAIIISDFILDQFLEEYIRNIVENGDRDAWSLYGLWKDLFESEKNDYKLNLRLRDLEAESLCDVQTCFLKILMVSIRMFGKDSDDKKTIQGSWFYLTSSEFDNVSTGICPLMSLSQSKYCFLEPLSMMAGLHYLVSSPSLLTSCYERLLEAMLDKSTTDQVRGSYFQLFIAMKISADSLFRQSLFEMALSKGIIDERTKWISNMVLPQKIFSS